MRRSTDSSCEESDSKFIGFVPAIADRANRTELRQCSAAFAALMVLALVWPAPVIWLNEVTIGQPLTIDEASFLGREAPSWDVVYWAIAGLFLLAMFHGRGDDARQTFGELREFSKGFGRRIARRWNELDHGRVAITAGVSSLLVAGVWRFADAWLIGMVERFEIEEIKVVMKLLNRLSGGLNPTMIILFFLLAGLAFRHLRWSRFALAMACSGIVGGAIVHILKVLVGRTRPEVWLGPFVRVNPPASSFPSGHTMSAFAIASILIFASRSVGLRVLAIALAIGIGAARVISFRHWPSDVLASGLIGTLIGWFFTTALAKESDAS